MSDTIKKTEPLAGDMLDASGDPEGNILLETAIVDDAALWPDPPKQRLDPSALKDHYHISAASSRYIFDHASVAFPVCLPSYGDGSNENSTVVLQLAPTQCRRLIHVRIERVGAWPAIPRAMPHYADGDLTATLLHHWDESKPPTLGPDGQTLVYTIEAWYLYAMNRAPRDDEPTNVGILALFSKDAFDAKEMAITRNDLYENRLDPGEYRSEG